MIKFIIIFGVFFSSFASASNSEQLYESYFDKTFIAKNITLPEAKRFRIIANAQLSGLDESSEVNRIVNTHKLLMLLVEFELLFPKDANYFNSKQLLTRYYNIPFNEFNQKAVYVVSDEITKAQGPVKTIEYLNRYTSSIKNIKNSEYIGYSLGLRCDLLAQLFITSEYENCIAELTQLIKINRTFFETQKINQLRYYYSTSALLILKTDKLIKEVLTYESIVKNPTTVQVFQNIHELLKLSADPLKLTETFNKSISISKIDLSNNAVVDFNSKKHLSILLLRNNKVEQAHLEATSATKISQSTPEATNSVDVQNSARLLELFFHVLSNSKKESAFDFSKLHIMATKPICTQNLLHNTQIAILLHVAKYKGDLLFKIRDSLNNCSKLVGLSNQESHIKVVHEIALIASQKEISQSSAIEIQNKYKKISGHFYTVNFFQLIIDALLKTY